MELRPQTMQNPAMIFFALFGLAGVAFQLTPIRWPAERQHV